MNQRAHTFEEESFFPSITDLMVGIIFIFIIIVMALILQIKDSQKSIPSSLITTLTNMSDQELAETEYLIENKGDISRAVKDLATEKIKNNKLFRETEILKNENIEIIDSNNQLTKENKDLQTQVDQLTTANNDSIDKINKNNIIKQNLIKDNTTLKDSNNQLTIENKDLQTQVDQLTTANTDKIDLIKDNTTLKDSNNQLTIENKDLQTQVDQLTTANTGKIDLINKNKILENKINKLKNTNKVLLQTSKNYEIETLEIVSKINQYKKDAEKVLLEEIRDQLRKKNVSIKIDFNNSILIWESEKMFSQGSEKLTPKGLIQINIITDVFKKVLPCFSGPPTFLRKSNVVNNSKKAWEDLQKKMKHNSYCSSSKLELSKYFKISSLIIEGHTDQDNRKTSDERKLSANRAISVFIAIQNRERLISALSNSNNEKIFGYGGYGRERPIIENAKKEEQKSKNRRIEFRFILEPPKDNIIVQLINNES